MVLCLPGFKDVVFAVFIFEFGLVVVGLGCDCFGWFVDCFGGLLLRFVGDLGVCYLFDFFGLVLGWLIDVFGCLVFVGCELVTAGFILDGCLFSFVLFVCKGRCFVSFGGVGLFGGFGLLGGVGGFDVVSFDL